MVSVIHVSRAKPFSPPADGDTLLRDMQPRRAVAVVDWDVVDREIRDKAERTVETAACDQEVWDFLFVMGWSLTGSIVPQVISSSPRISPVNESHDDFNVNPEVVAVEEDYSITEMEGQPATDEVAEPRLPTLLEPGDGSPRKLFQLSFPATCLRPSNSGLQSPIQVDLKKVMCERGAAAPSVQWWPEYGPGWAPVSSLMRSLREVLRGHDIWYALPPPGLFAKEEPALQLHVWLRIRLWCIMQILNPPEKKQVLMTRSQWKVALMGRFEQYAPNNAELVQPHMAYDFREMASLEAGRGRKTERVARKPKRKRRKREDETGASCPQAKIRRRGSNVPPQTLGHVDKYVSQAPSNASTSANTTSCDISEPPEVLNPVDHKLSGRNILRHANRCSVAIRFGKAGFGPQDDTAEFMFGGARVSMKDLDSDDHLAALVVWEISVVLFRQEFGMLDRELMKDLYVDKDSTEDIPRGYVVSQIWGLGSLWPAWESKTILDPDPLNSNSWTQRVGGDSRDVDGYECLACVAGSEIAS